MRLNKLCEIEDFSHAALRPTMRSISPGFLTHWPDYPRGREHRKLWEYAQTLKGLTELGAIHPDAFVLSVAGGHEDPAYELTNHVRWVFLTDIYGAGDFSGGEAVPDVLVAPEKYARLPFRRNRLVVQYMDALDLRFENDTFDAVFCLSSVEHFGGPEKVMDGLSEMRRVLKPGGILALTTECIVNQSEELDEPGLILFRPETLRNIGSSAPGLALVEEINFSVSPATLSNVTSLEKAVADAHRNQTTYPHLVLERAGRQFTSVSMFFRKLG